MAVNTGVQKMRWLTMAMRIASRPKSRKFGRAARLAIEIVSFHDSDDVRLDRIQITSR